MTRIREVLSMFLIDLGLRIMPYDELEVLIRMSIAAGVDMLLEPNDEGE